MIISKTIASIGVASMITMSGVAGAADKKNIKDELMQELKALLTNTPIFSMEESKVPGLYEVITGDIVFFYSPKGVLLFGEMFDKTGKNLTAEKKKQLQSDPRVQDAKRKQQNEKDKMQAELIKTLSLKKAVKIGDGPIRVIEFTDPDCPYCRKVEKEVLAGRKDITRYVFFLPLRQMHPQAANKAAFIVSQPETDKEKAFNDVFSGKYDAQSVPSFSVSSQDTILEHEKIVGKLGVRGVPAFYINNSFVSGADIPRISQLLAAAGGKEVNEGNKK